MTTFHRILPECIDYLPGRARSYLDEAARHPPAGDLDAKGLLALAKHGFVDVYVVMRDHELVGAFGLSYSDVMDILNLGGDGFVEYWGNEFWAFCEGIMHARNIETCTFTGRKGFTKLFPRLKPVGVVYEYKITKESL